MPSLLLGLHILDNVMKYSYCATNRKCQEVLKGPFSLDTTTGIYKSNPYPTCTSKPKF